jgi:hypothetical protein
MMALFGGGFASLFGLFLRPCPVQLLGALNFWVTVCVAGLAIPCGALAGAVIAWLWFHHRP